MTVTYELRLDPQGCYNGQMKAVVEAVDANSKKVIHSDRIDFQSSMSRRRFAKKLASCVDSDPDAIDQQILELRDKLSDETVERQQRESFIPEHVRVLGVTPEREVIIFDREKRRLWRFTRLRDIDHPTWLLIVGAEGKCDEGDMRRVRDEIAIAARDRPPLTARPCGQGIHCGPDDSLLIVSGNRAVLFKRNGFRGVGEVTKVEDPILGGKLIDFAPANEWVDVDEVTKLACKLTREQADLLFTQVVDFLKPWPFGHPEDGTIVSAILIALQIQAALDIRPHVWLYGPTNCGKTALLTFIVCLFPWAITFDNETSEAAIRQTIRNNTLPTLIDEFEHSRHRPQILKLLRSSTRGGIVRKGTPGHRAIEFGLRHICVIASIERGYQRAADRNRYITINLLADDDLRIVLPDKKDARHVGQELVALALAICSEVKRRAEKLGRTRIPGIDNRLLELFALPVAVWAVIRNAKDDEAVDYLAAVLAGREDVSIDASQADERQLLDAILSATFRVDIDESDNGKSKTLYREVSVAQVLDKDDKLCGGAEVTLEALGIKKAELDKRKGIFIHPKQVAAKLLKGTMWGQLNIGDILQRIPGAKRNVPRRLGGAQFKGVWIPLHALEAGNDTEQA